MATNSNMNILFKRRLGQKEEVWFKIVEERLNEALENGEITEPQYDITMASLEKLKSMVMRANQINGAIVVENGIPQLVKEGPDEVEVHFYGWDYSSKRPFGITINKVLYENGKFNVAPSWMARTIIKHIKDDGPKKRAAEKLHELFKENAEWLNLYKTIGNVSIVVDEPKGDGIIIRNIEVKLPHSLMDEIGDANPRISQNDVEKIKKLLDNAGVEIGRQLIVLKWDPVFGIVNYYPIIVFKGESGYWNAMEETALAQFKTAEDLKKLTNKSSPMNAVRDLIQNRFQQHGKGVYIVTLPGDNRKHHWQSYVYWVSEADEEESDNLPPMDTNVWWEASPMYDALIERDKMIP